MNSRGITPAVWILAALTAACASQPNPAPEIPVDSTQKSDLKALVGKWTGEYSSEANGRSGSIVFELKSGVNVAHGDVLMWPKGARALAPSEVRALPEDQLKTMPQILEINFVESQGGFITGTMNTYIDPDCGCEVHTTFGGSIDKDVIVGEYSIERLDQPGKRVKGRWKVTKQKA